MMTDLPPSALKSPAGGSPNSAVKKSQRQQAIRQLISSGSIRTQDDLVEGLGRAGLHVTQATISRDVEEMGLLRVRVPGQGTVYAVPDAPGSSQWAIAPEQQAARRRLRRLLTEIPLDTAEARAFLLVHTVPGSAHHLAAALDSCGYPEIVGTVAGDDTFLVAVTSPDDLVRVRGYLSGLGDD